MRGSSLFRLPLLKRWRTLRALKRSVHNGTAMPHLLDPPHFIHLADLLRTVVLRGCLFGNHLPVRPGDPVGWRTPMLALTLWYYTTRMGALSRRRGTRNAAGPMAPFADH